VNCKIEHYRLLTKHFHFFYLSLNKLF
jgi:acetyl-CoA synthetase